MGASTYVSIGAGAVAIFSVVFAGLALKESKRGNRLGATIDLFREYRSEQMRLDRRRIRATVDKIGRGEIPQPKGLADFPGEAAGSALRVSHYLVTLGVLVKRRRRRGGRAHRCADQPASG